MQIDSAGIAAATEANQDFSGAARIAGKKGHVSVFRNGRPKLPVTHLET